MPAIPSAQGSSRTSPSNLDAFRKGAIDFEQAVQAGNLFASLYIKAPLGDRYGNIRPYAKMLQVLQTKGGFESFEALRQALNPN